MSVDALHFNSAVNCSPAEYDSYTARFLTAYDLLMIRRLTEECRPRDPRAKLLDVGTGTARLLLKIAAVSRLGWIGLTGLEFFSEMTVQAWRTVGEAGLQEKIRIVQGDAHALPFDSGVFEAVISRSTIHHFAEPVRAIREMHRVLRPRGVAIVHEVRRTAPAGALSEFNRSRFSAGIPASTQNDKYTIEEVRQFIRQAGVERQTHLRTATNGYASIGMELCIRKD